MKIVKSSKNDLIKRGWFDESQVFKFLNLDLNSLLNLLKSDKPNERSIASFLLSVKFNVNNKEIYTSLIEVLLNESALYTRIEISKVLENGDCSVAEYMVNYLAKIGNNQYKKLPKKVSKKVSYPLPRDIIARILGKMDKANFFVLIHSLTKCTTEQLHELVDSVGFMIFYNPSLVNLENFNIIIDLFNKYKDDEIMVWKLITVLSAFKINESKHFLLKIKNNFSNNVLVLECERSLSLICIK